VLGWRASPLTRDLRALTVPLATKRIYDPATDDEGQRILVMRLWPRGIKKARVDAWYRDLAPELSLMRGFRAGEIPWEEYRERYRAGLGRPEAQTQLAQLRAAMAERQVTLFCGCENPQRCHRELLRTYAEGRPAARP